MSLTSCCYRLVDFNDAKIQRCHMICDIFVFVRRRKSTLNSSKIFRLGRCWHLTIHGWKDSIFSRRNWWKWKCSKCSSSRGWCVGDVGDDIAWLGGSHSAGQALLRLLWGVLVGTALWPCWKTRKYIIIQLYVIIIIIIVLNYDIRIANQDKTRSVYLSLKNETHAPVWRMPQV